MKKARLLYMACGSTAWGIGHLIRSQEIIRALKDAGASIISAAIVPQGPDRRSLDGLITGYDHCIDGPEQCPINAVDGVVLDVHGDLRECIVSWLKDAGVKAAAIDWYSHDEPVIASFNLAGGAEALRYAIIRREFLEAAKKPVPGCDRLDALVSLGGSDRRGHMARLLEWVQRDGRYEGRCFGFIAGPLFAGRLPDDNGSRVRIFRSPKDLPGLMASCTVGISNGGGVLMEFSALGIPTIIFPQVESEERFMKTFVQEGCAVEGGSDPDAFFDQLDLLWRRKDVREGRSRKARALIDGEGARRVVEGIRNVFSF